MRTTGTQDMMLKEQHADPGIHTLELKPGEWHALFALEQYKVLIAEGLNSTVVEREFRNCIVGYIVADRRVCLVLRIDHKKIRKMLDCFYEKVREGIRNVVETKRKSDLKEVLKQEQISREELFENLFEQFPLQDDQLVRLITGRRVELPYYDPNLERLKDKIRNNKFSSVLDYEGGQSPVLVKVMKEKDW